MKKKDGLLIAIDILFPIVFNVAFFLVGGHEKTGAEWTAYAFIHIAYLIMVIVPYILSPGTAATVLGLPIQTMSFGYFLFTLVFGIIIFIVNPQKAAFTVIVEIIAFALFAVLALSAALANEHTVENEAVHRAEVSYIKEIAAKLQTISDNAEDEKTRRMIERLYDIAHASPSKTNDRCADLENEILNSISDLDMAVCQANDEEIFAHSKRIANLLNERNRMLQSTY